MRELTKSETGQVSGGIGPAAFAVRVMVYHINKAMVAYGVYEAARALRPGGFTGGTSPNGTDGDPAGNLRRVGKGGPICD